MHRDVYTGVIILIVGLITINYISKEFIFEEKRLNKISENKFSSKITRYTVHVSSRCSELILLMSMAYKNKSYNSNLVKILLALLIIYVIVAKRPFQSDIYQDETPQL